MGYLHYGGETFSVEDRALLHVQIAAHEALRHDRSFFLTWRVAREQGSGRMSARISPSTPLLFEFLGGRTARINRRWVEALVEGALGGTGMILGAEPEEVGP